MKRALVFPGQASQEVGMAQDIFEASQEIRDMYAEAESILGLDIAKLSFEGPLEMLKETRITQPAIFVASAAFTHLLPESYTFDMVAGHSLGEFSALHAAGVLSFGDALRVVKVRAEGMQAAGEQQPGTMAAILNLSRKDTKKLCQHASQRGIVQAANYNSPGQIVISGEVDAVRYAMEVAPNLGARRAVELQVSGAFHSPLMAPARDALKAVFEAVSWQPARVPVVANCSAEPAREVQEIRENLLRQLESPVLWEDSVQCMAREGVEAFVEVGPGRVLQGLIRRIDRTLAVSGIQKLEDLENLV